VRGNRALKPLPHEIGFRFFLAKKQRERSLEPLPLTVLTSGDMPCGRESVGSLK
jgi:hypothetical protein